jgi:hypothetical protein
MNCRPTERQAIIDGAAAWVETYLWRAGLPDGVVTEEGAHLRARARENHLEPGPFLLRRRRGQTDAISNNTGGSITAPDGVTLFIAGLRDICNELGEDYKRVRHALVDQADDKKWVPQNARPAYAAPSRCVP